MEFEAKIISSSSHSRSFRISVPIKLARELKLVDDAILVIKLKGVMFPTQIYSNKGYYIFRIPSKLCKKYKLGIGDIVNLEIIDIYSYEKKNPEIKMVRNDGKLFIDRFHVMPRITNRGRNMAVMPLENKLILWPLSRNSDYIMTDRFLELNKIIKDGYNRKISLIEWLFEVIGLYIGEGDKGDKLGFTNSQPEIINHFINFLEDNYNIKRSIWCCNVIYRGKNFNSNIEDNVKKYWKRKAKVNNFKTTNYLRVKTRALKYGSLHIRLNSNVSRTFYDEWKKYIELAFGNKKLAIATLRGILAAEGWPELSKMGSLNSIEIASINPEVQRIYRKLLKCIDIDIKFKIKYGKVFGWSNFYFLITNSIFLLHPHRNRILVRGFLKHRKTKTLVKYLGPFSAKKSLRSKDVVRMLKLKKTSIGKSRIILNRLRDKEYLERGGSGRPYDPFRYRITKSGKDFLYLIKNLQNL